MQIVLQKFIAQSGYCSRRQAEELIRQKKVLVNDELAELGMKVDKDSEVKVRGKIIAIKKEKIYIVLNKPKGYTCTNRQFEGERNVFELLKTSPQPSPRTGEGEFSRLFVVGRLDKDSRGLVLITNDGDLTQKLTHPKFEHEKKYIVTITNYQLRITNDEIVRRLRRGVDIGDDDGIVKARNAKLINHLANSGEIGFEIVLTEGKKRQIRRMFRAVGCEIKDLVRVSIGNLQLGNLAEGKWRGLNSEEIVMLKK